MNSDMLMTDQEFKRIVYYMKNKYGIDMQEKKVIVSGRLENHIISKGYESYNELMNIIEKDKSGDESKVIVDLLTTNHTYFMREFEHFNFLKNVVLPKLKKSEDLNRDLRIWCGAASTGEEPYTIAMVLKDYFGIEHSNWDTRVLATDISTRALGIATKGVYPKERIDPLPDIWKRRYFKNLNPDEVQVKPELKDEIIFRKFNLMDPLPFKKKMHIIFLRNVMIYFDNDTKNELLERIYDFLEPGGYLFIGMTETLDKSKTRFKYIRPAIYQKPIK